MGDGRVMGDEFLHKLRFQRSYFLEAAPPQRLNSSLKESQNSTMKLLTIELLLLLAMSSCHGYISSTPHPRTMTDAATGTIIRHTSTHKPNDSALTTASISIPGLLWPPLPEPIRPTRTRVAVLNPLEVWWLSHLDAWYKHSQSIKCPFFRRRIGDTLDNLETIIKHTIIRPECWDLMGPPQAWRPAGSNYKQSRIKYLGLSTERLKNYITDDWKPSTGKGYYVTGKVTTAIYRDDCFFGGPDPDMPIRGLRKYLGVAAHLFDSKTSRADLLDFEVLDNVTLQAHWQMQGILKLPWHPHLPVFRGETTYHLDSQGLIERHEETWDLSVAQAFVATLFPKVANSIWKEKLTV
jgi:hypothetical protein